MKERGERKREERKSEGEKRKVIEIFPSLSP